MIKAIVFDMDGVLIDAKEWHYDALNRALDLFGIGISRADHLTTFDGLPTKRKLELLSITEGLPRSLHTFLNDLKQIYTMEIVSVRCKPVFMHEFALSALKDRGLLLAVASNSVRKTVESMMDHSNLGRHLDLMMSNQDVFQAKPNPEIYVETMKKLHVLPEETLILEDNENGIQAARESGAHLLVIKDVLDVNFSNIDRKIQQIGGYPS